MDDVALMGVVHGPGQCFDKPGRGVERLRRPVQKLGQAVAVDEFQGEVRPPFRLADVIDLDDVGMPQAGHGLGFLAKALELLRPRVRPGQDHLQGHEPIEPDLPGLVDDTHAAAAELAEDLVIGDHRRLARHGPAGLARGRSAAAGAGECAGAGRRILLEPRQKIAGRIAMCAGRRLCHGRDAGQRFQLRLAAFAAIDVPGHGRLVGIADAFLEKLLELTIGGTGSWFTSP